MRHLPWPLAPLLALLAASIAAVAVCIWMMGKI
jgi:hypothetical protein